MEHIETICSIESKVLLISIHSIRIPSIPEVIAKTSSKITNCLTLTPGSIKPDSLAVYDDYARNIPGFLPNLDYKPLPRQRPIAT